MVDFEISLQGSEYENKWSLRKGQYQFTLDKKCFTFSCPTKTVSIMKTLVKKSGTRQKNRKGGDYCFLKFGESSPQGSGEIRIFSSQVYEITGAVEAMLKRSHPRAQVSQERDQVIKRTQLQSRRAQSPSVEDLHSSSGKGIFKWIHSAWRNISLRKTKKPSEPIPTMTLPVRKDSLEPEEADERRSNSDGNYEYEYVYEYCAPTIDPSLKWHKNSATVTEYSEDIWVQVDPGTDGRVLVNERDIYSVSQAPPKLGKGGPTQSNPDPAYESNLYN